MIEETANSYSEYMKVDIDKKLLPINASIDEMFARLEEFQMMISLVQMDSLHVVGPTGALTAVIDYKEELDGLCKRIDAVEKLVEHIRRNLNYLENKVEEAEESIGLTNKSSKLKAFLKPLLKMNGEPSRTEDVNDGTLFKADDYFAEGN